MKTKTEYSKVEPYTTKDGSIIRELIRPESHTCQNLSLAEATILPGEKTLKHFHQTSEEVYHVIYGRGIVYVDGDEFYVVPGDTICIRSGRSHWIKNTGHEPLKILCCCSPPYSHDDTYLA